MTIDVIRLPPSAYQTMIAHAFTHEKEEIAGIIVGDKLEDFIQIYAVIPLERMNHESNRVEVSEEQLIGGMAKCEEISKQLKKNVQILGWYHSHPHITIFPSNIDLETQLNFQAMEADFFGLILSVFVLEQDKMTQSIEIIAFRTSDSRGPLYPTLKIEPIIDPMVAPEDLYTVSIESWMKVPDCAEKEIKSEILLNDASNTTITGKSLQFMDLLESLRKPMITCSRYMNIGMNIYKNQK